jgi:hypothetical protein
MSAQRQSSLSPAARSKPATVEKAWRRHCKFSAAGSRCAVCKYIGSEWMPPMLWDFAEGDRYHKVDPSLKPMSGGDFEKWQCVWEQERMWKAAWEGSSSGGAPRASDEEEEAEEGEDPLFLEAVVASKKEAAVKELMARKAAATTPLIILDD